jgi:arylsulfatase A-like enzyme
MIRRFTLLLAACSAFASIGAAADKPNVLIIVADDLGYNDVAFQGSKEIPTPNLDKLAAQSVRCTNGYVSHPFCSPTRAGLLTGRYQHRFGHENNPVWLPEDTKQGLPLDQITLPQVLKQNGYTTGHVGKWHLGAHPQFHPQKRGFDENFTALGGGHIYFAGAQGGPEYKVQLDRNGVGEDQHGYLTDQFGDEAAAFVKRHTDGKPWFLYFAFNAPHTPLQAPPQWLEKFASIKDVNRRTYAAMVAALDENVGKVLTQLEATKQRDNTLITFISDNGGPHLAKKGNNMTDFTDNSPLRGCKGEVYDGGIRVPFLVSWPAKLKPGTYAQPVISLDFFTTAITLAGGSVPADRKIDGVNLIPYLTGENAAAPHDFLFWRSGGPGGNYAARMGDWKYVRLGKSAPELYNLKDDIGESKNLASDKPEVLAKLDAAVAAWDKETIAPVFAGPKQGAPKAKAKGKAKK